jgi:HK97 family phage major capsid protein
MLDIDPTLAEECRQHMSASTVGMDGDAFRAMVQSIARNPNTPAGHWTQNAAQWDETHWGNFLNANGEPGEIIAYLRPMNPFTVAGSREVTLPPTGRLPMGRQVGVTDAYWVGQNAVGRTIPESKPTFGGQLMQSKKLAVIVTYPNEFIRFGTAMQEAFVKTDVAAAMAYKEGVAMFSGPGGFAPLGLIYQEGLLTHECDVVGANGDTFMPIDLDIMAAKVEEQNIPITNFAFMGRPLLWARAKNRRADAVTGGDQAGPYLFGAIANEGTLGGIKTSLGGYRFIKSTMIPSNRVKGGSGATLTMVVAGEWSEHIIGRHGVLDVAMSQHHNTNFKEDLTSWRFIEYVDAAPRRPNAFVICDDVLPDA